MKRANVRIDRRYLLEALFGRGALPNARLDMISVDQSGDLVLQIVGNDVPEGDCVAVMRTFETIGGSATVFQALQPRD